METILYILDVGQGNMVWIKTSDNQNIVFDCNLRENNAARVFSYLRARIANYNGISQFICSHRDNDHICGIRKLHRIFPIRLIRDSDQPGENTESTDYQEYMRLRREIGFRKIERQKYVDFGQTRLCFLSARDERLPANSNA